MALARQAEQARSHRGRGRQRGVIVAHPAADQPRELGRAERGGLAGSFEIVESRVLDEARLEGVRLAAREMAHLLNNDLAVAVGLVELLQERSDLPPHLRVLLESAVHSLDSAARHIEAFQNVVRVAVKETPAGASLDLEGSQPV